LTTAVTNITVLPIVMGMRRTDEELMLDFQRGDVGAFEEILKRHRHGVFNFIFRFLGNRETAEEVFQEVFIKLHRAADRYQPNGKFSTWLYTITRNQCVDTFRRRRLRDAISLDSSAREDGTPLGDTIPSGDIPPDVLSSAHEIQTVLELALEKLNADQREVFLLREKEGFKFEEIAEMTGVSVNTVKSRMRYALEGLKRTLKKSRFRELLQYQKETAHDES
jgi:RNA polymerase sigma-70 factor (ECF subfamily)